MANHNRPYEPALNVETARPDVAADPHAFPTDATTTEKYPRLAMTGKLSQPSSNPNTTVIRVTLRSNMGLTYRKHEAIGMEKVGWSKNSKERYWKNKESQR